MGSPPLTGVVFSGGGARAAYQVGILTYLGERIPDYSFPILSGVSAGAINAAFLAGHRGNLKEAARDLREAWMRLSIDHVFRADIFTLIRDAVRWILPFGPRALAIAPEPRGVMDTAPLARFLRHVTDLAGIEANISERRLLALALSATNYTTGERITFVQGRPGIRMWERSMRRGVSERITLRHVMASSAIPLLFPAVRIGPHYYGDGSVRQSAPLAPAIHLGAERILAISVRYRPSSPPAAVEAAYPLPAQIIGHLFHSIFLDALDMDIERMERINNLIAAFPSRADLPEDLRPVHIHEIRPSLDVGKLAIPHARLLPRPLRLLLRGLGVYREASGHFLSYLAFVRPFISQLIEMGYRDAEQQGEDLLRFLRPSRKN